MEVGLQSGLQRKQQDRQGYSRLNKAPLTSLANCRAPGDQLTDQLIVASDSSACSLALLLSSIIN